MKKMLISALMLISLGGGTASTAMANHNNDAARAKEQIQRLHEIRKMDFKSMNRAQKQELRKEVLGIKKDMQKYEPILVISLGAALLIALLLILLL